MVVYQRVSVKRIQPFYGDMVEGYNANATDDIRM